MFYFKGGFVPRDPILDGPFFESKYSSINYHPNRNPIPETQPEPQVSLPSITESPKIVENGNFLSIWYQDDSKILSIIFQVSHK